ncbi:hypothetical protein AMK16_02255 [Streptomyces sp. CB00455]|uniref:STAS domain-containing protein n=1 Tax=Streptomyces sp. CB00455 TaxID=1703927 RepID=UPI000939DFB1|nr:STAS domain-containing protein [Streptomyces sp. CB00455]OKK22065.1 hypothetical protein AMK16_02255 [Streptomyces sp. CB00455]
MSETARVQALPDQDGTRVIVCVGEFDITSTGPLREALEAAARDGVSRTVLDLVGLSFADSTLLNTLIQAHNRQHLVLAGPLSPQLARLFEVTGTDAVFHLTPDLASACAP